MWQSLNVRWRASNASLPILSLAHALSAVTHIGGATQSYWEWFKGSKVDYRKTEPKWGWSSISLLIYFLEWHIQWHNCQSICFSRSREDQSSSAIISKYVFALKILHPGQRGSKMQANALLQETSIMFFKCISDQDYTGWVIKTFRWKLRWN